MSILTEIRTHRKPQAVTHYAYYGDTFGPAQLVNGSGYLFRADGARTATLVSDTDPDLLLLGLCALAEMQADLDILLGGPAWLATHRAQEVA